MDGGYLVDALPLITAVVDAPGVSVLLQRPVAKLRPRRPPFLGLGLLGPVGGGDGLALVQQLPVRCGANWKTEMPIFTFKIKVRISVGISVLLSIYSNPRNYQGIPAAENQPAQSEGRISEKASAIPCGS